MGERAGTEKASEVDLGRMKDGLREALRSGALGFSTTRSPEHEYADGDPVAARLATWDEVVELVHVLDEFPRSVFQFTQTGTTTLRRGAHSDELERQVHDLAASTSATIMFTVTGFQKDGKDIYEGLELVDSLNRVGRTVAHTPVRNRSEEHTSELQSLMRISSAVFCLKKKKKRQQYNTTSSNK